MNAAAAQPLAILHSSGTLGQLQAARRAPQLLATHPAADDADAVGVGAMITGDEPKDTGTT